jgi:peroxiredoxin
MRRFVLLLVVSLTVAGCARSPETETEPAPTPEETTLTEVGQHAPDFTVATLEARPFTLSEHRGRVVLINWFATWCPPCQKEMPHLQSEVWERFRDRDFVMISVARQEKADVVAPFVKKYGVTWPFGLDPDRAAYARYAEAFIPRNTVVDRDGTIIFQSSGFERPEFEEMIRVIAEELEAGSR